MRLLTVLSLQFYFLGHIPIGVESAPPGDDDGLRPLQRNMLLEHAACAPYGTAECDAITGSPKCATADAGHDSSSAEELPRSLIDDADDDQDGEKSRDDDRGNEPRC
jgi:hypothetical protein